MLKYSYRFDYQKTTATLLAFLLEGDHFPGAFDAEVLKPYVRSRFAMEMVIFIKCKRADKRSHPNEDNQANEEYYRPSSSLSMNVPLESRLKVCIVCNPFSRADYVTSAILDQKMSQQREGKF